MILVPLHGEGFHLVNGQRQSLRASKVPGRRWIGIPSRSRSPPRLVRGPGFGLAAVFTWTGQRQSPRASKVPGRRWIGIPSRSRSPPRLVRGPAGGWAAVFAWTGQRPALDPLPEPEPGRLILVPLHGEGFHPDRPAASARAPGRARPALDLDPLPEPVNLAEPGRLMLVPLHGEGFHLVNGQRQSPRASPAGAGPDTLPKALAALVNLPEPKPAAAGSRPRCRLGGRRHLDRPAAAPEGEQGPRPALDRDTLPKALAALDTLPEPGRLILAPLHAKGFHLVTGQRSSAPGRTLPALDLTPSRRPSRRWSTCRSPPG